MILCSDDALKCFVNFKFFSFCIFSLLVYLVLNQKAKGWWLSKNEREPTHPRVGGVVFVFGINGRASKRGPLPKSHEPHFYYT
jgi:hypothetical protein